METIYVVMKVFNLKKKKTHLRQKYLLLSYGFAFLIKESVILREVFLF